MPQTLYEKIWNKHIVHQQDDGTTLLYVDRHLIHEVTSPQAFEGLRLSKRQVRKPNLTLAVADHNVPTTNRSRGIDDKESKIQVETLEKNCKEFGIELFIFILIYPILITFSELFVQTDISKMTRLSAYLLDTSRD